MISGVVKIPSASATPFDDGEIGHDSYSHAWRERCLRWCDPPLRLPVRSTPNVSNGTVGFVAAPKTPLGSMHANAEVCRRKPLKSLRQGNSLGTAKSFAHPFVFALVACLCNGAPVRRHPSLTGARRAASEARHLPAPAGGAPRLHRRRYRYCRRWFAAPRIDHAYRPPIRCGHARLA
jgi:hypothetical protein